MVLYLPECRTMPKVSRHKFYPLPPSTCGRYVLLPSSTSNRAYVQFCPKATDRDHSSSGARLWSAAAIKIHDGRLRSSASGSTQLCTTQPHPTEEGSSHGSGIIISVGHTDFDGNVPEAPRRPTTTSPNPSTASFAQFESFRSAYPVLHSPSAYLTTSPVLQASHPSTTIRVTALTLLVTTRPHYPSLEHHPQLCNCQSN